MTSRQLYYLSIGLKCAIHLNVYTVHAQWNQKESSIEKPKVLPAILGYDSPFNCMGLVILENQSFGQ